MNLEKKWNNEGFQTKNGIYIEAAITKINYSGQDANMSLNSAENDGVYPIAGFQSIQSFLNIRNDHSKLGFGYRVTEKFLQRRT